MVSAPEFTIGEADLLNFAEENGMNLTEKRMSFERSIIAW